MKRGRETDIECYFIYSEYPTLNYSDSETIRKDLSTKQMKLRRVEDGPAAQCDAWNLVSRDVKGTHLVVHRDSDMIALFVRPSSDNILLSYTVHGFSSSAPSVIPFQSTLKRMFVSAIIPETHKKARISPVDTVAALSTQLIQINQKLAEARALEATAAKVAPPAPPAPLPDTREAVIDAAVRARLQTMDPTVAQRLMAAMDKQRRQSTPGNITPTTGPPAPPPSAAGLLVPPTPATVPPAPAAKVGVAPPIQPTVIMLIMTKLKSTDAVVRAASSIILFFFSIMVLWTIYDAAYINKMADTGNNSGYPSVFFIFTFVATVIYRIISTLYAIVSMSWIRDIIIV